MLLYARKGDREIWKLRASILLYAKQANIQTSIDTFELYELW